MKNLIKEYFIFSRKETYISILLLAIIIIFIVLPYYQSSQKVHQPMDTAIARIAAINLSENDSNATEDYDNKYPSNKYKYANNLVANYTLAPFEFDPNSLTETGWIKLGLPIKTIKTILNYRNKGGSFRTAEDIRKIWGLKKEDADILIPYINIAAPQNLSKQHLAYTYKKYEKPTPQIIDINTASMEDFRALPAVGNAAYKIIKYRERLGGFLAVNQLKESNSITDSVYIAMLPFLKLVDIDIQKLNINTLSDFELSKHPYISRDIAKAIEIYRTQHGKYKKIDDIKKIVFINQVTFQKIAPYITVD